MSLRWVYAIPVAIVAGAALLLGSSVQAPATPGTKGRKADPISSSIRTRIVGIAQSAVGLNGSTSAKALGEFLGGPGESDVMKTSMALSDKSSTCELFARAVYRIAGFALKALYAPYAISSGIEPLVDDAKKKNAWVEPTPGATPSPGDIITGDFPTATAHVRVLKTFDPSTGRYTSIDGGATDAKGHQEIVEREGVWKIESGVIMDHPTVGNVHKVTGWIDADKYWEAEGLAA